MNWNISKKKKKEFNEEENQQFYHNTLKSCIKSSSYDNSPIAHGNDKQIELYRYCTLINGQKTSSTFTHSNNKLLKQTSVLRTSNKLYELSGFACYTLCGVALCNRVSFSQHMCVPYTRIRHISLFEVTRGRILVAFDQSHYDDEVVHQRAHISFPSLQKCNIHNVRASHNKLHNFCKVIKKTFLFLWANFFF